MSSESATEISSDDLNRLLSGLSDFGSDVTSELSYILQYSPTIMAQLNTYYNAGGSLQIGNGGVYYLLDSGSGPTINISPLSLDSTESLLPPGSTDTDTTTLSKAEQLAGALAHE